MEKTSNDILIKERSYRRVTSAAFHLYARSFRNMLKAQWMYLAGTAIVWTAVGLLVMYDLYFLVPLAALAVILELAAWLMLARWLTKRPVRRLFRAARRHWLLLLGVVAGGVLALLPVCALVSLPLVVLLLAEWESQSSTLMGDPSGMPGYMPYLTAAVWLVSALLQICIRLLIVYVGYYAWGSAEARRRERERQKLNIQ